MNFSDNFKYQTENVWQHYEIAFLNVLKTISDETIRFHV